MEDLEVLTEYQKSIRGRASTSLQDLKKSLSKSPVRQGKHATSPSSSPRLRSYFASASDYETAVERLRNMLKEQDSKFGQHDGTRPKLLLPMYEHAVDKESPGMNTGSSGMVETLPRATELMPLINNYISYIHQLQGKNRFIEEELKMIKLKMEEVVDENTRLHEELKNKVVEIVLNQDSEQDERKMAKDERPGTETQRLLEVAGVIDPKNPEQYKIELEKIAALYSGKTKRLESQLAEARDELERAENTIDTLKSNLRMSESHGLLTRDEKTPVRGFCLKCAQNEAVIASTHIDVNVKLVERLTGERDDLMNTVTRLKSLMEDMRRRETDAHEQVTRSIELIEQVQLEKTQALVEKEQLKDEIQRQLENYKKMLGNNQLTFDQEKELYRQECAKQMEHLQQQLQAMIARQTMTENQMEKTSREKADLLSELEQAKSQITDYSSHITKKTATIKLSNATAIAQRDEANRQLKSFRNKALWEAREREQEIQRLHTELKEVKRRLTTAEKQAARATEDHVRSIEKLSAVEKTAHYLQTTLENLHSSRNDKLLNLSNRAQQREEELINMIEELETKHTFSESELETMVNSQKTLIGKLREECLRLTNELEKLTDKYKLEVQQLKDMNNILSVKLDRLSEQHREMESQCVQHAKIHQVMTNKLKEMDKHAQTTAQQVVELLNKVNTVTRERDVLKRETGFLQDQLDTQTRIALKKEQMNLNKN